MDARITSTGYNRRRRFRAIGAITAPVFAVAFGGISEGRFDVFPLSDAATTRASLTFDQFDACIKLARHFLDFDPETLLEYDERDRGRVSVLIHRARKSLALAALGADSLIKTEGRGSYRLWATAVFVTPKFHKMQAYFGGIVGEIISHPRLSGIWEPE